MKKDHVIFLLAGLAFGFLLGFGAFRVASNAPGATGPGARAAAGDSGGPRGPMAPTQVGAPSGGGGGGGGGAPMMAEINALKERLQADPNDLPALVRLANLHHDVQMFPQAVSYYERAIAIAGEDPDLLTDLGICYRGLGRFDDALQAFDRAHAARPQHWQSLYNAVIVAAFDLGRFDRAEAALAQLETFEPKPPNLAELKRKVEEAQAANPGRS